MNATAPNVMDRIGLEKLSSLPQAAVRLLQVCNDPDTEFNEINRIVSQDVGLTSKMLHVANSPLYAQWGETTDLNRLLVVLGFNAIRTVAVTSSILEFFAHIGPGHEAQVRRLWYRTLHCALVAKHLGEKIGYPDPEQAYLTGLLHKVGQLVLLNHDPERYTRLLDDCRDTASLSAQEQALFGITHAELGASLLELWHMAPRMADAVLYQHEPASAIGDTPENVKLINRAVHFSQPDDQEQALSDTERLYHLERDELLALLEKAEQDVHTTARSFGVDVEKPQTTPAPVAANHAERGDLVRSTAIAESVRAAMWSDYGTRAPVAIVHTFFTLLFGLEAGVVFLKTADGYLRGLPAGEGDAWAGDVGIKLEAKRSLLCDALLNGRMVDSFDHQRAGHSLMVVDRQLIRRCGRGGLLVLPLISAKQTLGVFAAGVDQGTLEDLSGLQALLGLFAGEAAKLFLHHRQEQEKQAEWVAESQARMRLNARKVRHEINNPLGIITNYLHILGSKLGEENPVQRELEVVRGEIDRVNGILQDLTERLDASDAPQGMVDLNNTISALLPILNTSLFTGLGIEVKTELERGLAPIAADQNKLKQVLINLLKNAAEAMPEGGHIRIATRGNVLNESGRWTELTIRDSGPGLTEHVRSHLFQPVTSTKGGDHGGLGLSICAQLVKDIGGHIQCRTHFTGTEFTILLRM